MSSSVPPSPIKTPYHFPANFAYDEFLGVDLIPIYDRRLERIDTTNIKLPDYDNTSLYILIKHVGYVTFAYNLQNKNRALVLDRPSTEASWMRLVTSYYHLWDPRERASKDEDEFIRNFPFWLKMSILEEAKQQMQSDDAQWYWHKQARRYSNLNIKTAFDTMKADERLDYDMWMTCKPNLPNEELNEDDLEILGLGLDGGYVEDGEKKLKVKYSGNGDGNEEQLDGNAGNIVVEDRMELD